MGLHSITFYHESLVGGQWSPSVAPDIRVVTRKKMTMTAAAGRDFEVIETIGLKNYAISIRGIHKVDRSFLEDSLKDFVLLTLINQSVEVSSPFLAIHGISKIMIETASPRVAPGVDDHFSFSITAFSDEAPEFQLTEL